MSEDKLAEYDRKRDFSKTAEPRGEPASEVAGGAQPRFVVQEHHARRLHWDLRIEHEGVAASFALPNGVPLDPKDNRMAVRTEDHPLEYLEFEGEIPEGSYGAGTMTVLDRGTVSIEKWDAKKIEVTLHGERITGRYALFVLKEADWMIHRMDPSQDRDRVGLPEHIVPMLAKAGELPRDGERWGYEVKWDGVRALAYALPGRLRFESRNLNDITEGYPELRSISRAVGHREAVLDGEIVAFDADGHPSFERLQQRMHVRGERQVKRLTESVPVVFVVFDLLYLDGRDLTRLPYSERRERLEALALSGPQIRVPRLLAGDGAEVLEAVRAQGLEGIIAKRLDSRYEPGRRGGSWLKVKNVQRDEFVIGAWMPGEGRRRESIGSLAVGQWDGGELRYAGNVGTGFSDAELERLAGILAPLEREDSPFSGRQPGKGAVWVQPSRAASVEYLERTGAGMIRAPSYKGLVEPDESERLPPPPIAPGEVEVDGRRLKLTNLDKVLYPATGFTKGQVIEYYARIAPVLVAHLDDRPLTLKRYPNGVEDKFFFEKNCPKHAPDWIPTGALREPALGRGRLLCLQGAGDARVARSDGRARAASAASPRTEARDADGAGLRSGPRAAGHDRRMLRGGAVAERDVRAVRPAGVRQDVRVQGPADLRPAQPPRRDVRADQDVRQGRRRTRSPAGARSSWSPR